MTENPALSITELQAAFGVLGNMVDADGEPMTVDMVTLVGPWRPASDYLRRISARHMFASGRFVSGRILTRRQNHRLKASPFAIPAPSTLLATTLLPPSQPAYGWN